MTRRAGSSLWSLEGIKTKAKDMLPQLQEVRMRNRKVMHPWLLVA